MACVPPLCHGTGGCGSCNCKCCPPPCCDNVRYRFECGTPAGSWGGPPPNTGCDCILDTSLTGAMWGGIGEGLKVAIPKFDLSPIMSEDEEFVFGLAVGAGCSVPCSNVTVNVTTTGCCLEILGGSVYVIGNGTINCSVSEGGGQCGTLTPKINGSPCPYTAQDCQTISVTLEPANTNCCECCMVEDATCTDTHFAPTIFFRTENIKKGSTKYSLNKQKLLDRVLSIAKSRKVSSHRPTSPKQSQV